MVVAAHDLKMLAFLGLWWWQHMILKCLLPLAYGGGRT